MTTIGPQKKKIDFRILIIGFLGVLMCGAFVGIPLYNDIVDLKHTIRSGENQIASLEVENAETKEQLYQLIDPSNLERAAQDLGLILDKKPAYIEVAPRDLAHAL